LLMDPFWRRLRITRWKEDETNEKSGGKIRELSIDHVYGDNYITCSNF